MPAAALPPQPPPDGRRVDVLACMDTSALEAIAAGGDPDAALAAAVMALRSGPGLAAATPTDETLAALAASSLAFISGPAAELIAARRGAPPAPPRGKILPPGPQEGELPVDAGGGFDSDARLARAYHEVGHAVVAVALGQRVDHVTIQPRRRGAAGLCYHRPTAGTAPAVADHAGCVVAAAGAVACRLAGYDPARASASLGDRQIMLAALSRRHGAADVDAQVRGMADAEWQAHDALQEHWPAVERLAAALAARGELAGWEVHRAVSPPPAPPRPAYGFMLRQRGGI